MKITILFPNLYIPFKYVEGIDESYKGGNLPRIRQYWQSFLVNSKNRLLREGHEVTVIEKPLWRFTLDYCQELAKTVDEIWIPHKDPMNFNVGSNAKYYMQTAIESYFSVDSNGWGASLSFIDDLNFMNSPTEEDKLFFRSLQSRIIDNVSKFEQPKTIWNRKDYFLFVCQIPHDEVIKNHSDISVAEALISTIELGKKLGYHVIVKGHPVNPSSMGELKNITKSYGSHALWIDNVSIHDALENAETVFMVNSGVGFESACHMKPTFRFGNAEYRNLIPKMTLNLDDNINIWNEPRINTDEYIKFISEFFKRCYN